MLKTRKKKSVPAKNPIQAPQVCIYMGLGWIWIKVLPMDRDMDLEFKKKTFVPISTSGKCKIIHLFLLNLT